MYKTHWDPFFRYKIWDFRRITTTTGERTRSSERSWPCRSFQQRRFLYARLQEMASTQKLQQLMQYVGRNWITGRNTWPPSSWSVFMKFVRTNNDIEGWHFGLNRRASGKSQLPLYLLIRLLHHKARRTSLQIRFVSEERLRRIQKKSSETSKLRSSTSGMSSTLVPAAQEKKLKACSYLNGPGAS